ncbi:MAG TPA: hypothetical protein VF516_13165 [Kofleriaceae bacterium]
MSDVHQVDAGDAPAERDLDQHWKRPPEGMAPGRSGAWWGRANAEPKIGLDQRGEAMTALARRLVATGMSRAEFAFGEVCDLDRGVIDALHAGPTQLPAAGGRRRRRALTTRGRAEAPGLAGALGARRCGYRSQRGDG